MLFQTASLLAKPAGNCKAVMSRWAVSRTGRHTTPPCISMIFPSPFYF
ncbi:hypothetical protein NEIELOOT_02571 [Neisseria elongata subsp. glycolytica ATCC 29315]|uniref:Uncharacterized protein n=1 Tax=Neisseria elongata subsp. glycolytica ATCC 29315 TaxID=546263 RepID=D4DU14_NEIEG|nr:hypothetical protein NEIELOOT_02571 [Neisseria elongata subsp. glycolytica ATCC 29315]